MRLRLGPLCLPSAAVSLGLSLAAHGVVLVAGIAALRLNNHDHPPAPQFARGDGRDGAVGGFFVVGATPPGFPRPAELSPAPAAPGGEVSPPATTPLPPFTESDPDDPLPDWPATDAGSYAATGGPERSDATPFGVSSGAQTVAPRPRSAAGGNGADGTGPGLAGGAPTDSPGPFNTAGSAGAAGDGTPGIPGGVPDQSLPAPVYPRESLRRREQGTVVVEVDVDADGSVSAVRVVDDCGFPRLAEAALAAVRKHAFRPATEGGRAVACRWRIPFRFRLR